MSDYIYRAAAMALYEELERFTGGRNERVARKGKSKH